jgi:hypothetical protein
VPLTAAFYLTWLASGLDGRARWRRTQTEGAPEVGAWPPPETLPSTADQWATLRAVMEGGATFSSTDVPEAAPIPLER